MSKRVLFIGGTGEISAACVADAVLAGHLVTTFNRGKRATHLTEDAEHIRGDIRDRDALQALAEMDFDVVCQFLAFTPEDVSRDAELFGNSCSQYIFISSASAYQKPLQTDIITEETPLDNPFWAYSRNKAACEEALEQTESPYTIVRPSHTYRERVPSTVIDGQHLVWRLLNNKPVIVHDEGKTLWTITRSEDFARAFTQLFDSPDVIGETFHITDSQAHTWNDILSAIAALLEREPELCPVSSKALVEYDDSWTGPLLGDKGNNAVFDNTKISLTAEGWACEIPLLEGLQRAITSSLSREGYLPDPNTEALIDRIIKDHG